MKDNNLNNKTKKPLWDFGSDESNIIEFPWPPRSYTCSFCKREFRSAQALGGHMNVHRRDRARLRQYSPPTDNHHHSTLLNLNLDPPNPNMIFNPNPNPNPSFPSSSPSPSPSSSSSPLTKFPPFTPKFPSSLSSSNELIWGKNGTPCNHLAKMKTTKPLFVGVQDLGCLRKEKGCSVMKDAEVVTLDLGIGMFNETKQDLDLELRLGYT